MSGKNVLNNTLDVNNRVHRSPFDKSYQNNLTFNIGQIIPAFCQLCPPGSSIRVNPTFALQFMPMAFPIQTRMRAQLSFYKVPLRTLWKDYTDFVGNFKKGLIPPYMDAASQNVFNNLHKTGSLGDYFGLPTTLVGSYGSEVSLPLTGLTNDSSTILTSADNIDVSGSTMDYYDSVYNLKLSDLYSEIGLPWTSSNAGVCKSVSFSDVLTPESRIWFDCSALTDLEGAQLTVTAYLNFYDVSGNFVNAMQVNFSSATKKQELFWTDLLSEPLDLTAELARFKQVAVVMNSTDMRASNGFQNITNTTHYKPSAARLKFIYSASGHSERTVSDITKLNSPFYDSTSPNKEKQIMISAYPFRAYEAVYNAYYRDNRNNPYVLNGELEYNKWIPTDLGGADTTVYKIRYKNWEQDFLTTAVQSPQQGIAPLVGLTTYTETLADGMQQTSVSLVDEQGDAYKVQFTGTETSLDDVTYTTSLDGVSYKKLSAEEKATLAQPRSLYDLATTGISIADLRYVNAYQKYLEMNMRKGYSYRDVIKGHFDTNVRFDALMLPEYIGGTSQDVSMNSIVQTVETSDSGSYAGSLGSMAGNATVRGSSHPISCYCDEESYVIGLLSVSPVPNYSQLLPKHFLHRDLLDSYYPEFDNIGFQPITYKEVCPIQAFNSNVNSLSSTFGYQRAWYDYITQTDEVHGLFRTNLRNFLINRVFDVKPELAESFLLIDPKQVNDVFSVTESSDKIFGQIWFDYTAKLPISRTSIPKLD